LFSDGLCPCRFFSPSFLLLPPLGD
jgi:hypothetical protein